MSLVVEKAGRFVKLATRNPLRAIRVLAVFAVRRGQGMLAHIGALSGTAASAYYLFVSGAFKREHQAVLKGKLSFRTADSRRQVSSARLRRNTHRLEKGLIMRPRRPVFAESYIGETVSDYKKAYLGNAIDEGELIWARDVLALYFSCVENTPRIEQSRKEFERVTVPVHAPVCVPYPSSTRPRSEIPFDKLKLLFQERRSTRWFEALRVPRDIIEKAIDSAALAPSACNRQPFSFAVLDQPELAASVAKLAGGTGGFAENIPCLIASVGDLSCYPEERDRHLIYIDASLANMQLMLALQTLGLSTCAINWPDIADRDVEIGKALALASHERVVMLIAVGYAADDGKIPYSQKKPHGLLIRKDHQDRS